MNDYLEQGYADAFNEFPALAVHEGTPDFEPVLYLAMELMDGDMQVQIEMDLKEIPWDDPDELSEWLDYMNRVGWIEDEHGGTVYVKPVNEDGDTQE